MVLPDSENTDKCVALMCQEQNKSETLFSTCTREDLPLLYPTLVPVLTGALGGVIFHFYGAGTWRSGTRGYCTFPHSYHGPWLGPYDLSTFLAPNLQYFSLPTKFSSWLSLAVSMLQNYKVSIVVFHMISAAPMYIQWHVIPTHTFLPYLLTKIKLIISWFLPKTEKQVFYSTHHLEPLPLNINQ